MRNLNRIWWNLVRFGFRLLYNEMAFSYDMVSWVVSLGAWRCWQRASLPHLERAGTGGLILELAHGTGNLQIDLQAAGYQTVGYDLSPYMGRIAAAKLRRAGQKVRLARGMAQQLPFPDHSFSAVVSSFPTDFIIAPDTLKEINRVLHPDGVLVVVTNGILTDGGIISQGLEWLYWVTGQREEPHARSEQDSGGDLRGFFAPFGFETSFHQSRCPRSVVQIIVARKKV